MPILKLLTEINAPIEVCFDLSRSINFHTHSLSDTNEKAVDGVLTGLIGPDQQVTWQAKHFGIILSLTSQIKVFDRPYHFRDSMIKGPFKRLDHDHYFEAKEKLTLMSDIFDYESPLGFLGQLADKFFLEKYMINLLTKRNQLLKAVAETEPNKFI